MIEVVEVLADALRPWVSWVMVKARAIGTPPRPRVEEKGAPPPLPPPLLLLLLPSLRCPEISCPMRDDRACVVVAGRRKLQLMLPQASSVRHAQTRERANSAKLANTGDGYTAISLWWCSLECLCVGICVTDRGMVGV